MKLEILEIEQILHQSLNDAPKVQEIIKKLQVVAEELKAEKAETKVPKAKNQFVIVCFSPANESGLILQISEGEDTGTVLTKLSNAARSYNQSKRGTKNPITNIANAASLKRKWLKEQNISVKTKIPVRILNSDNSLV